MPLANIADRHGAGIAGSALRRLSNFAVVLIRDIDIRRAIHHQAGRVIQSRAKSRPVISVGTGDAGSATVEMIPAEVTCGSCSPASR